MPRAPIRPACLPALTRQPVRVLRPKAMPLAGTACRWSLNCWKRPRSRSVSAFHIRSPKKSRLSVLTISCWNSWPRLRARFLILHGSSIRVLNTPPKVWPGQRLGVETLGAGHAQVRSRATVMASATTERTATETPCAGIVRYPCLTSLKCRRRSKDCPRVSTVCRAR